jgi:acetyl esterase/lipase
MKSKLHLLKINWFFLITLLPSLGFCNIDYNHQRDVVYGYKDGMALVMDVYSPKTELNKAGVIVVIAGGLSSNPEDAHRVGNRSDVKNLLRAGYVVFAATHSSQPKYNADEIQKDIPRAVRFIRFNADNFGIDPFRLGIIGHSSGGHISLMAAMCSLANNESEDPIDKVSSKLQAVVAYYPSTDLLNFGTNNRTILEHFHSVGYMLDAAFDFHVWDKTTNRYERIVEPEKLEEYYKRNSAITYVATDNPPILLIHGDQDKLVPLQQSELLVSKLKEIGVTNKLYVVQGKGHGFNFKNSDANEIEEVLSWFQQFLLEK